MGRFTPITTVLGDQRLRKQVRLGLLQANFERWTGVLAPVLRHLNEQFARLGGCENEERELSGLRKSSQKVLD
jgi:hypothetical protein